MSHFTTIQTQIKDIAALQAACDELALALIADASARGYLGNQIKGDYVIQLKGPYDIALNHQPDRSYGLTADLWQGHVEREVGPKYGRLTIIGCPQGESGGSQERTSGQTFHATGRLHQTPHRPGLTMKPTIEIIISPTGAIAIDAVGFKGTDCEQATWYLEQALGIVSRKERKSDYHNRRNANRQQRIGS